MTSQYFDLACDLWIVNEFLNKKHWNAMSKSQQELAINEQLDDEFAGYGLPDDYTAGKRAHLFADDSCEVWLASCNPDWFDVEKMITGMNALFLDIEEAIKSGSHLYVLILDGREIVGELSAEVTYANF